ncbi:MAG: hypothetical protein ACE5EY_07115 [Anaerolineae bacterium]
MLRYSYPLAMLVLLMVMCDCLPINRVEDGWLLPLLAMGGGLVLSAVWPLWVGPRLHEPAWRKLAERLHLTYKPFGGSGPNPAARVEGLHHEREIRLTTKRIRPRRRRGPMMEDFLSLAVPVELPSDVRLEIRNKPRTTRDPRFTDLTPTGNAAFDRRLMLFTHPAALANNLTAGDWLDDLAHVVLAGRQTTITLSRGNLLFEEKSNLFTGAESRPKRLERLISVMVRLADALAGASDDADSIWSEPKPAGTPAQQPAGPFRPGSIGDISARIGYDVRDLMMAGYSREQIHDVETGKITLKELWKQKPKSK